MSQQATLTITSGPDRGRMFAVDGEMVNIGVGDENEVKLTDDAMAEHHASIALHNDQYVIYSPVGESVSVEGTVIPAERWVKLPVPARIQFGDRTTGQFVADVEEGDGTDALPADVASSSAASPPKSESQKAPPPPPPPPKPNEANGSQGSGADSGGKKRRSKSRSADGKRSDKGKRSKKGNRKTARFITDTGGDAKVALGDDGTLPELVLAEATAKKVQQQQKKDGNPLVAYAAVGFSLLMSLGLLFVDSEPATQSMSELNKARQAVKEYYRHEDGELKRYQKLLRQAAFANARKDRNGEVQAYRQVLKLLNSEDNERSFLGLTGDRENDERLREYVSVLVGR